MKKPLTTSMPEFWEIEYQSGEVGWDQGGPTPIFSHWIDTCKEPLSICVLGAGNGWDAINFALKGHLVTAVDFAESAVKNMKTAITKSAIEMKIIDVACF